jgi:integrase
MGIETKTGRDRLPIRREPHWLKIGSGKYLGFRKTDDSGFWIARYRDRSGKQRYSALGELGRMDFDAAAKAGGEWFATLEAPRAATAKTGTVKAACAAYVADLETLGRPAAALDAKGKFALVVDDDRIGQIKLDRLTRDDVIEWRDALVTAGRKKSTANRILRTFKAALTKAAKIGYSADPFAWESVDQYAGAERSRELFLTKKQRNALVSHASPELAAFLTGLIHTGARPGELARATVADFDRKQGNLTLRTGKGRDAKIKARHVPLTREALKLFRAAAKSKLPAAPLFTDQQGAAWHRVALSRGIRAAAKGAKLPANVVGYSIRHAVISEWLSAGIDAFTVGQLCGTSVAMIERYYGKFIKAPALAKIAGVDLL